MPLSPDLLAQIERMSQGPEPAAEPPSADLTTQLLRGSVSGLTSGLVKPYAAQGQAGLPEQLANLAGMIAGFIPVARGAGLGVAGLAKLAPKLLAPKLLPEGVAAGTAAANMLTPKLGMLGKSFAPLGHTAATLAAIPIQSEIEAQTSQARGEPVDPLLHRLGTSVAVAGLGGLGSHILSGRAAARAVKTPAAGVAASMAEKGEKTLSDAQNRIQTMIDHIDVSLSDPKIVTKEKNRLVAKKGVLQEALETSKKSPLDSDVAAEAATSTVRPPVQKIVNDQFGQLAEPLSEARTTDPFGLLGNPAREAVLPSKPLLPAGPESLTTPFSAEGRYPGIPQPGIAPPGGPQGPLSAFPMAEAAGNQPIVMPPARLLDPAGLTSTVSGATGVRRSVLPGMNPNYLQQKLNNAFYGANVRPDWIKANAALDMIASGESHKIPMSEDIFARILGDVPFPKFGGFCDRPGSFCGDPDHVLASGYAPMMRAATKYLGKFGRIVQPSWVLGGIPILEKLPLSLAKAEGFGETVVNGLKKELAQVYELPAETKKGIQTLFLEYADKPRDEFFREAFARFPDARDEMPKLMDVMDRLWLDYVSDGALSPKQRITNYFPRVRATQEVPMTRTLMIEQSGDQYYPREFETMIRARDPQFAKTRSMRDPLDPKDWPTKFSFDDTLDLYLRQYGRHAAIRQFTPEINEALAATPDYLKPYVGDHVNFWLGKNVEPIGNWNRYLRDYQFARTIGWNVLSPLINTMQRLNTFAVVHPASFTQAFNDMKDPLRLSLLDKAGLSGLLEGENVLQKLGVDIDRPQGFGGKIWETLRGGQLFSNSEVANRKHAFFAGIREAERRGITDPNAQMDFGWKIMADTQFIQSRADLPPLAQGGIGRIAYQFQSFRLNQIRFMARLVDEAVHGAMEAGRTGDPKALLNGAYPFLRFWTPSILLAGPAGILPGDWSDEQATKAIFGKAMRVQGLSELLFGVSLGQQLGLGSIGLDDPKSFMFYLPGPTIGSIQALMSAVSGRSMGSGLDISQIGRTLNPDEQARQFTQIFPGGVQANRLLAMLRLIQSDGEYRRPMDVGEFLGANRPTGDLLAQKAANLEQIILQGVGLPSQDRELERKRGALQRSMLHDHNVAVSQASSYMVSGHMKEAKQTMTDFAKKYEDELQGPVSNPLTLIDPKSLPAALIRQHLAPGQRRRAPLWARNTTPFLAPPPSIFEEQETQ